MNLFLYWINEDGGIVTQNMKTWIESTVGTAIHKMIIRVEILNFLIKTIWQRKYLFFSEN